jgi:hypothetical protein
MSKDDEYRDYAARTMDLAQRASSSADKGRLLMMAEAWLDLADRVPSAMEFGNPASCIWLFALY